MLDLTYIFCIYSFLGWIVEVVFFYIKTGVIHKRGILSGPYCPLYGFSLAVCTIMTANINSFILEFIICAMICTGFELITAIVFDKMLGHVMWDYTRCRFNLNGYICLTFSLIWGVVAVACIHLLNPIIIPEGAYAVKAILSTATITFMSTDVLVKAKA